MTPEEIQAMAKGLAEGQALWYLLSAVIGGAIAGLGGYLAEKGKNRATKEDIATITREVEQVRDEFNRGVEDLKASHQLRMVAAERRIQAHQEAFMQWQDLADALGHGKYQEAADIERTLRAWERKNCMFLGEPGRNVVRRAVDFSNRMLFAAHHRDTAKMEDVLVLVAGGWESFVNLGNELLQQIDLPPMRIDEIPSRPVLTGVPA